jgi:hypothetical protein
MPVDWPASFIVICLGLESGIGAGTAIEGFGTCEKPGRQITSQPNNIHTRIFKSKSPLGHTKVAFLAKMRKQTYWP